MNVLRQALILFPLIMIFHGNSSLEYMNYVIGNHVVEFRMEIIDMFQSFDRMFIVVFIWHT